MDWKDKYSEWVTKSGGVKPNTPVEIKQSILIERASVLHNNKYDYSQVSYVNNSTKVIIICPVHGPWGSVPNNHINGSMGCKKCAAESLKKSAEQFIVDAKKVHGSTYDYSLVDYTSAHKKVLIGCPIHGKFSQVANDHLKGRGCPVCARNQLKTTEKFIEDSVLVHKDKYSYNNTQYTKDCERVVITCPVHGDFSQAAGAHLQGQGCPSCRNREQSNIVYIFTDGLCNYKIGIAHDISKRKVQQEKSSGLSLTIVAYKVCASETEARLLEKQIHKLNYENPYSISKFDGYTEWRTIPTNDLKLLAADNNFIFTVAI